MSINSRLFRKLSILGLVLVGLLAKTTGQTILTFHHFMEEVMQHHPVAAMSEQVLVQAQQALLKAKGAFDPAVGSTLEQKQFAQKQYYSYWHSSLDLPTRWGTKFLTGFDQNGGQFLNPQDVVPENGLWFLGLEQPLLKGLWYDERRAQLDAALNAIQMGEQDQRAMRLDLYFQAAQAYFQWLLYYRIQIARQQAFELATERWQFIKERHRQGDLPAVDTLEALATRQSRRLEWADALLDQQKSYVFMQAYLWDEQGQPRGFLASVSPDTQTVFNAWPIAWSNPAFLTGLLINQPELTLQKLKIEGLQIERKLSLESLKPDLTLSYLPLRAWTSPSSAWFSDYKWKVGLKFPLFFRKGLGEKRSLESKINLETWQLADKKNTLTAKLEAVKLEIINVDEQMQTALINLQLFESLLSAERTKLAAGESSLFLINARESAYLSAQEKYFQVQRKFHVAWAQYHYLSGNPTW